MEKLPFAINKGSPLENSKSQILKGLKQFYPELVALLTEPAMVDLLEVPQTHKSQPMARLLRSVLDLGKRNNRNDSSQVLANTSMSIKAICASSQANVTWLHDRIMKSCSKDDFETAGSALGEIRALGALMEITKEVEAIPETKGNPTADFLIDEPTGRHVVEVHTKQMNTDEAQSLINSRNQPKEELGPAKPISFRIHHVFPGGHPNPGETTMENVASKFAGIKPNAEQAADDCPSILWLDLQDEDWWGLTVEHAAAFTFSQGELYSGDLWNAFYGEKNTPVFEGHSRYYPGSVCSRRLGFPGKFHQSCKWSAAVLSFPKDTIVFEHFDPTIPLNSNIREMLTGLRWFNYQYSVMDWPSGVATVSERIRQSNSALSIIAKASQPEEEHDE